LFLTTPLLAQATHSVRAGDTLSSISRRYGVAVEQLREWNGLRGNRIYPRQRLRVATPQAAAPLAVASDAGAGALASHVVAAGETLYRIALRNGISVDQLRSLNGLTSNRIYVGQRLRLRAAPAAQYQVQPGDSLSDIAVRHDMALTELMRLNSLSTATIHPGQKLNVKPTAEPRLAPDSVDWLALLEGPAQLPRVFAQNGPYFHASPRSEVQNDRRYSEAPALSPRASYRRAAELFAAFDAQVSAIGRTSSLLEGWHFVLDPGHGGVDPGAIVKTLDGNGDALYVVEDEYVYDIALRLYVMLRLHGAQVTLTILSPNHLLRRNVPAARTFVHERNEVFNHARINERNRSSSWPKGGSSGLSARREVIEAAFAARPAARTVFLSLHADNSPGRGPEPVVLYYQRPGEQDSRSARFAKQLLPALGRGARSKGQQLAVLRGNPADVSVLIELRNLAYAEDSWSLRFAEDRQADAERVLAGLLAFAEPDAPSVVRAR
jgi:LysM repeat protein